MDSFIMKSGSAVGEGKRGRRGGGGGWSGKTGLQKGCGHGGSLQKALWRQPGKCRLCDAARGRDSLAGNDSLGMGWGSTDGSLLGSEQRCAS